MSYQLPGGRDGLLLVENTLPHRETLRQMLLPESGKILLLEYFTSEAHLFLGSLLTSLVARDNRVIIFSLDNNIKKGEMLPPLPSLDEYCLVLHPPLSSSCYQALCAWCRNGVLLEYEVLPDGRSSGQSFFFGVHTAKNWVNAIRAYKGEVSRTPYWRSALINARYQAEISHQSGRQIENPEQPVFNNDTEKRVTFPLFAHTLTPLGSAPHIDELSAEKGSVVVFSPHADDMEIAVGGLIHELLLRGVTVYNLIITESHGESDRREREALDAADILNSGADGRLHTVFLGIHKEDLSLPETIQMVNNLLEKQGPTQAFLIPHYHDLHPTHRRVTRLFFSLFRGPSGMKRSSVFFYQAPWSGRYNTFFASGKKRELSSVVTSGKNSSLLAKKILGYGGLLGEICGDFGGEPLFFHRVARFIRRPY